MLRTLSLVAAGLSGLLLVCLVTLRLGLAWLVGSDEFRLRFNDMLESGLRSVLPAAMTEVQHLELSGFATIEAHDLVVRSSRAIDAVLAVPHARFSPELLSVFTAGPLRLDIDAALAGGGQVAVTGAVPKSVVALGLFGSSEPQQLVLDGTLSKVDAAKIATLLFPDGGGPSFQLVRGQLDGSFSLVKPYHGHGSRKAGKLTVTLGESAWRLPTDEELTLPPVDVAVELAGFSLTLRQPLRLTERSGQTALTGALELPTRMDDDARWDLGVDVTGDAGLARALARLFRCKLSGEVLAPAGAAAESVAHFTIKGPVTGPTCAR